MSTAVNGVDIVGEGQESFFIIICIAERNLGALVALGGGEVDYLILKRSKASACVYVFNKLTDTALVTEFLAYILVAALVGKRD